MNSVRPRSFVRALSFVCPNHPENRRCGFHRTLCRRGPRRIVPRHGTSSLWINIVVRRASPHRLCPLAIEASVSRMGASAADRRGKRPVQCPHQRLLQPCLSAASPSPSARREAATRLCRGSTLQQSQVNSSPSSDQRVAVNPPCSMQPRDCSSRPAVMSRSLVHNY